MADGQHSRTDGGVPAAGRETARRACPELSRRALLGAVCALPVLSEVEGPVPSRHPGLGSHQSSALMGSLDPESTFSLRTSQDRRIPDQVRDDGTSESFAVPVWDRALARFRRAEAALKAAEHIEDDATYDRILGRHNRALRRFLRTPAPDLRAFSAKLDLAIDQDVATLTGGEACLESLKHDARRLAATRF